MWVAWAAGVDRLVSLLGRVSGGPAGCRGSEPPPQLYARGLLVAGRAAWSPPFCADLKAAVSLDLMVAGMVGRKWLLGLPGEGRLVGLVGLPGRAGNGKYGKRSNLCRFLPLLWHGVCKGGPTSDPH